MSSGKYHKRFEHLFKKEMVRLVQELGRSLVEVVKAINITKASMLRWITEYGYDDDAVVGVSVEIYPKDSTTLLHSPQTQP